MEKINQSIYLRDFIEEDAEALTTLEYENREFFQPFTSLRKENFYTISEQLKRIQMYQKGRKKDETYAKGIFHRDTNQLIGTITLSGIVRDVIQSAWLGYSLDQKQNGKGYTTEAISLMLDEAFQILGLHRIEAGVQPHNLGSIRVLEKAGFQKEGLSRQNVKINGEWKDHYLFAILSTDERPNLFSETS
ncbi:GNAT family N-acetyltransferase [Bacillus safensis]|uniref:GNAT family N-acetyltransferase n=1 Tax=Bacillus safensis TaxID=561879 RepID=UPI00115D5563|nr:GNAT family protein [Bacillus sp. SDF0016]TQR23972.1 N-acetyltransferase [Bacillus sp. SDF0016]